MCCSRDVLPGSIIGGMPTDSNVWMKDVCILCIARGLLADSNVLLEGCWDTWKHYERYVG